MNTKREREAHIQKCIAHCLADGKTSIEEFVENYQTLAHTEISDCPEDIAMAVPDKKEVKEALTGLNDVILKGSIIAKASDEMHLTNSMPVIYRSWSGRDDEIGEKEVDFRPCKSEAVLKKEDSDLSDQFMGLSGSDTFGDSNNESAERDDSLTRSTAMDKKAKRSPDRKPIWTNFAIRTEEDSEGEASSVGMSPKDWEPRGRTQAPLYARNQGINRAHEANQVTSNPQFYNNPPSPQPKFQHSMNHNNNMHMNMNMGRQEEEFQAMPQFQPMNEVDAGFDHRYMPRNPQHDQPIMSAPPVQNAMPNNYMRMPQQNNNNTPAAYNAFKGRGNCQYTPPFPFVPLHMLDLRNNPLAQQFAHQQFLAQQAQQHHGYPQMYNHNHHYGAYQNNEKYETFLEKQNRLVDAIHNFISHPETNRSGGPVPSERVQNCIKAHHKELYEAVVGGRYGNQWHKFLQQPAIAERIMLCQVDKNRWYIRLPQDGTWEDSLKDRADEKSIKEDKLRQELANFLQRKPVLTCTPDEFLKHFKQLAESDQTIRDALGGDLEKNFPRRGQFVRFVKKNESLFSYDNAKFEIRLNDNCRGRTA